MTIKHIQARFTSGNEIPIDKAVVHADEWRMAMAEIWVLKDEYIWKLSEVSQLQEQNTMLDAKLAEVEKDARFKMEQAYEHGWCEAACRAKRSDLFSDIGSPAYINDRDANLDNVAEMEAK